jgi:opacity protein-like surface antigen
MKKFVIASVISLAAISASALEVGLTVGTNYAKSDNSNCGFIIGPMTCSQGQDRTEYGLTVGERFGRTTLTAGIATSTGGSPVTKATDGAFKSHRQNRYSLTAGYDLTKIGAVTVTPKVGVAYLDNSQNSYSHSNGNIASGYAMTVGLGASIPVTKQISVGLDYSRQYGQDRVQSFDGDRLTAGVVYKF